MAAKQYDDDLAQLLESFSSKVSLLNGKPSAHILVDRKEELEQVAKDLVKYDRVAFDAEGVDLSRDGALTVACFQGFDSADQDKFTPIYVVDVHVLGGDIVFPKTSSGELNLRKVLEDPNLTKVTFDCRTDSDALFHQFNGVKLTGTIDLQVFDQAVRIHKGEAPPTRSGGWKPYVKGMAKVSPRYSVYVDKANAPHRDNFYVWRDRPMSEKTIEYAAKDIEVIRKLWYAMEKAKVSDLLMQKTIEFSARYERIFREASYKITYNSNKIKTMEEIPIISKSELPSDHPSRRRFLY